MNLSLVLTIKMICVFFRVEIDTFSVAYQYDSCNLDVFESAWFDLLSICTMLLFVSVMKMSPRFFMLSLDCLSVCPHRRGDLVSFAWRWIRGGLAMANRGIRGHRVVGCRLRLKGERVCS